MLAVLVLLLLVDRASSTSSATHSWRLCRTSINPRMSANNTPALQNAQQPTSPLPPLPRRLTLSGGGVPEINAAVQSDETELLESEALADVAVMDLRGGAAAQTNASSKSNAAQGAAALEAMRLHRQHMKSSLAAGVGSGILASVVCAPLDLVRTRMQVAGDVKAHGGPGRVPGNLSVYQALKEIIQKDGFRGCFRGLGATLATVPALWGLYFPLYEHLKKDFHLRYDRMKGLDHDAGAGCPPLVHMGAAITAGAAADCICNPMFLIRTRMQTEALHYFELPLSERVPHGMIRTAQTVYAEGGILAFWRGLTASLLGLGHVAIQFPVYEFLKSEARAKSKSGQETPLDLLLASGASKMCASLLTYPHEVSIFVVADGMVYRVKQRGLTLSVLKYAEYVVEFRLLTRRVSYILYSLSNNSMMVFK